MPLSLLVLPLACTTQTPRWDGPMSVRSQHPAQLTVLQMTPRGSAAEPGAIDARWSNAYSSLFLAGQDRSTANSFRMDGEYWRSELAARAGLGHGLTFEIAVPFGHTTGGFLDDFVVDWHDFFGFPNHGRDTLPRDQFVIRAERSGNPAFEVAERSFELADIPLELAWSPWQPGVDGSWGGGVRAAIELPTGDADAGFGNGEVDVALGVFAEYQSPHVAWTAHAEHTFAGTPDRARRANLEFADVISAGVGAEIAWFDGLHALVQVEWTTSTLRELGFPRVADQQWNLWFGGRVSLGPRTLLEVAVAEDLAEFVAPDFTIWLTLRHGFGH